MASLILIILTLLLFILTRKKTAYGIMCYYAIRMTIPVSARILGFSFNTICLGLLIVCLSYPFFKNKQWSRLNQQEKGYARMVFFVLFAQFGLTLLWTRIPLAFQWSSLFQLFATEILPSLILLVFLNKEKDCKRFEKVVCLFALFAAGYGIYTYLTSTNPIYEMFNTTGEEGKDLLNYASGRAKMSGIAVGIYDEKIALSLISLLLFTFLFNSKGLPKTLFCITLIIAFVCIILTTQRAALFCLIAFLFIVYSENWKKMSKFIFVSAILLLLIPLFVDADIIFTQLSSAISVFDDKAQEKMDVSGSSVDMRVMQLINSFEYLKSNILQGMGYNFSSYYYTYIYDASIFGMDPRFYGFESFILTTAIGSGLLGLLVWSIFFFRMYKILFFGHGRYYFAFYISYILAIILTNSSGSLYLFFILVVLNRKKIIYQR